MHGSPVDEKTGLSMVMSAHAKSAHAQCAEKAKGSPRHRIHGAHRMYVIVDALY